MNLSTWTPFYFEGNQAWGWITSPDDWENIKEAYKDIGELNEILIRARRNPNNTRDAFGFYHEYNGDETLGDFFKAHKMVL